MTYGSSGAFLTEPKYMITGFSESGKAKAESGNTDLVIPATDSSGRRVEGIATSAFRTSVTGISLTSVKFPEDVMTSDNIDNEGKWASIVNKPLTERGAFVICSYAFNGNELKEVIIPEGVLSVGTGSFQANKLERVVLPSTVMNIDGSAFIGNTNNKANIIDEVVFPAETDFRLSIQQMAFMANHLTEVLLPKDTLAVGTYSFRANNGTSGTVKMHMPETEKSTSGINTGTWQTLDFISEPSIVTFNGNGGYTPAPGNEYVNDEGSLDYLPTPEAKECGQEFDGWYTAAEGGTIVNIDRIYSEDTTIYAHWKDAPPLEKVDAKDSDCTNKGNIEHYKCTTCGKLFSDENGTEELTKEDVEKALDPDAHDWDEGEVTKKPTLTEPGEKTYTCKTNSEHTKKEEIPKLTDALKVKVVDENGKPVEGLQLFADCGDEYEQPEEFAEATDADGFAELDISDPVYMSYDGEDYDITFEDECWEVTQPVSFVFQVNLNQFYYYIESVNGAAYSGDIVELKIKHNHDMNKTEAKAATCAEEGNIEYYTCSKCNKLFKDEVGTEETTAEDVKIAIDPNAHEYGEWTELDKNQHQRVCANDNSHVEKEAHKWDGGKVTKKPTTAATGVKTYTCSTCKATKTETIAKLKPAAKKVLVAKGIANGKTAATISWNNVGADRYVIYLSRCNHGGKTISLKKVKTVNGKTLKWKKTKLLKNKSYKFKVVAQKKSNGKYKNIATSMVGHFMTGNVNGSLTNPKAITLKKSAYTLKKGKTATIKATVSKVKSGKKLGTKHAKTLRYISNNPAVATVSGGGKITAKSQGTAQIYVQTINGIWKVVKVTVK